MRAPSALDDSTSHAELHSAGFGKVYYNPLSYVLYSRALSGTKAISVRNITAAVPMVQVPPVFSKPLLSESPKSQHNKCTPEKPLALAIARPVQGGFAWAPFIQPSIVCT